MMNDAAAVGIARLRTVVQRDTDALLNPQLYLRK